MKVKELIEDLKKIFPNQETELEAFYYSKEKREGVAEGYTIVYPLKYEEIKQEYLFTEISTN